MWFVRVAGSAAAALGALVFAFGLLPFETARAIVDRLAADREADAFGPGLFAAMAPRLRWAGVFLTACGLGLFAGARPFANWFAGLAGELRSVSPRVRAQARLSSHAVVVILCCLLGLSLRLSYLDQTARYDEIYTYQHYSSKSLARAVSDYSAPNNHLLNTVLVWGTTRLFGDRLWAWRLPALILGVLLLPVGYWTCRELYGREAALIATALLATSRYLIEYSANARGYGFVALFTLLCVLAGARLADGRESRLAWTVFCFSGAAGLASVPTMLYPLGGVALWMFAERGRVAGRAEALRLAGPLAMAAGAIGLAAAAWYLPAMVYSGPEMLLANPYVRPLGWNEWLSSGRVVLRDLWVGWSAGLPRWLAFALALAALGGLAAHRAKLSPLGPLLAWAILLSAALRVAGYARVWVFLLPFYLMAAAAGLLVASRRTAPAALAVGLAAGLAATVLSGKYEFRSPETIAEAAQVAAFLDRTLASGDRLVSVSPANLVLADEIRRRWPRLAPFLEAPPAAQRIILVAPAKPVGPDEAAWSQLVRTVRERQQLDLPALGRPREVARFGSVVVYEFFGKP
jgi:hypothetical protein